MPNPGERLLEQITRQRSGTPTLWWLGRCGFAVKYYDILFYVDPVLNADSPMQAAEARDADLILCTHVAHLDAATVGSMLDASPRAKVVLPKSNAEQARAAGIPFDRMTTTDSDLRIEYFKTGIYARVYAVPSARPALDWTPIGGYPYLGYLIRCGDVTIYHAGACVPYDGLAARLKPYNVNVALLPVGDGGFLPEQSADLAAEIGARWLIPMGGAPQQAFLNHMLFQKPEQRFKIFESGEGWQVPEDA